MSKEEMVSFMTYLRPPGFVQEYIGGPTQVMDVAFEEKGRYRANFFTSMGRYCAVVRVIKDLAAEHRTMLLVTHDMRLAADVSDHVIFLHQGLIEEEGPPETLFGAPRSARLQQFLRATQPA